jgi:hypothetical protein
MPLSLCVDVCVCVCVRARARVCACVYELCIHVYIHIYQRRAIKATHLRTRLRHRSRSLTSLVLIFFTFCLYPERQRPSKGQKRPSKDQKSPTIKHTSDVMASPTSFALTEGGSLFSFAARTSAAEREVPRINQGERRSGKKRPRGPCQKFSKVSALVHLICDKAIMENNCDWKRFFLLKKSTPRTCGTGGRSRGDYG